MFATGKRDKLSQDEEEQHQLTTRLMGPADQQVFGAKNQQRNSPAKSSQQNQQRTSGKKNGKDLLGRLPADAKQRAKLAREESIGDDQEGNQKPQATTCAAMAANLLRRKRIFIPLIILLCVAAIYCVPYIEIQARTPKSRPHIPFNFQEGPLRASSASQFKIVHLFRNQVHGPESVALDSAGNMYMAIEGGFILYAHLNKSSPVKRSYYDNSVNNASRYTMLTGALGSYSMAQAANAAQPTTDYPDLVKIAELNPIKSQVASPSSAAAASKQDRRARLADYQYSDPQAFGRVRQSRTPSSWRRECQLDEKVYGPQLYSNANNEPSQQQQQQPASANEVDTAGPNPEKGASFSSHVLISRCSKPLGIRLSLDESYLYVVDTLSGLYRISLKVAERPHSTQRLVTRLLDFRHNKHQLLPVVQPELEEGQQSQQQTVAPGQQMPTTRGRAYLNVSLMAIDDLVLDHGAGSRGADLIYLSLASQNWQATSFLYDNLEGRPTGAVLRYDTGSNQLSILNPAQVSLVRTIRNLEDSSLSVASADLKASRNPDLPYLGLGAPHLDENDVFDDRPLYFTNGLELTDDKQALLIVDTSNKRIIKHYIRGDRRGTSDHWAWTPNFPDNIRRGSDKRHETYWVVGCGQGAEKLDMFDLLREWPMLRKYILKNVYLFGWLIEQIGAHLLDSTSVRDFGYSLKIGNTFLERGCVGMMILQYNKYGDVIRTIHSKEFPQDTVYYSQVNEVIDAISQEHILYLGSPSYNYVTKLTLPTNSFDLPTPAPLIVDNNVR